MVEEIVIKNAGFVSGKDGWSPSDIIFRVGSDEIKEIIKLCANGDIFVKGKLIQNDEELVQGMKDFLAEYCAEKTNLRADLEQLNTRFEEACAARDQWRKVQLENTNLRRQVSIYEKALEQIAHKDMNPEGVAYAAIKYARAALEEGRK